MTSDSVITCYKLAKGCDIIIPMELFLIVLRNVFIALAILFLLVLIVGVTFVWSFASIMSHHNHDITVILTNRRDNLVKLADLLNAAGIKIEKKKNDNLRNFDLKRIENQDGEDAKNARDELTSLQDYFLGLASDHQSELKEDEYQLIINNILELEKVYRHHVMMYNADVLGYNFWINFLPTRFIFKILKFKRKDNI